MHLGRDGAGGGEGTIVVVTNLCLDSGQEIGEGESAEAEILGSGS